MNDLCLAVLKYIGDREEVGIVDIANYCQKGCGITYRALLILEADQKIEIIRKPVRFDNGEIVTTIYAGKKKSSNSTEALNR